MQSTMGTREAERSTLLALKGKEESDGLRTFMTKTYYVNRPRLTEIEREGGREGTQRSHAYELAKMCFTKRMQKNPFHV